jgi:hypothetical protein
MCQTINKVKIVTVKNNHIKTKQGKISYNEQRMGVSWFL